MLVDAGLVFCPLFCLLADFDKDSVVPAKIFFIKILFRSNQLTISFTGSI